MRRTFALLSLPAAALALAAVASAVPAGTSAAEAAPAVASTRTLDVARQADAGAPVAVAMTNWVETNGPSQITPPVTPPGTTPKR